MSDASSILSVIDQSGPQAADRILPLVYDELRKLAARKMAGEPHGQTLDATALVHEAYLRLVGGEPDKVWDGRAHFFAAAAEAMRRILVEKRCARHRLKRGGQLDRAHVEPDRVPAPEHGDWDEMLAIDGALDRLAEADPSRRRAGQAPLFRRVFDRRRPPTSSASHHARPTASGATPAPGCAGRSRTNDRPVERSSRRILAWLGAGRRIDL